VTWLESEGFDAVGFDASVAMLEQARGAFPDGEFVREALPDLKSVDSDAFDNVLCSATLMHLRREDLNGCVINLARVLRPAGRLILTYRDSREGDEREADGRLFTAIPVGKLVLLLESAGFPVVDTRRQDDSVRPDVKWSVVIAENISNLRRFHALDTSIYM